MQLAFCGEAYAEAVIGFPGDAFLSEPEHMEHLRDEGLLLWDQVGRRPLRGARGTRRVCTAWLLTVIPLLTRKAARWDGSLIGGTARECERH